MTPFHSAPTSGTGDRPPGNPALPADVPQASPSGRGLDCMWRGVEDGRHGGWCSSAVDRLRRRGVLLPSARRDGGRRASMRVRAVSANDHFVSSAPWLDGLTALAAVVERSGGMKLATTVALVALRGPVPLAKALSALDVLSDGRVIAGVGPGSSKADYDAVGVPFEQRWQRFDETLQLIRAVLQPATAGGAGDGAPVGILLPPPRQSREIPVWIGSWGSRAGMRRIAPGSAMAGLPRPTTPPRRLSRRPWRSWAVSSKASNGRPAISRMRLSRYGPGLPAAAQRPTGFCPRSSLRWSGETRRTSAAGSASARRGSAPSCCPDMPARDASESTSGLWVTSGAR
jgi:Luciferase-like monooxygenase